MKKKKVSIGVVILTILLAIAYELGIVPSDLLEEEIANTGTTVVRVVDGDTVIVKAEGEERTVRLIGINTPETVDPRKPVECFGKEASKALKEKLLAGDEVVLIADSSQAEEDRYGRWLRYVEEEGEDVGAWLLQNGYAQEYTYKTPYQRSAEYQAAEEEAKSEGRGLWGDVCNN